MNLSPLSLQSKGFSALWQRANGDDPLLVPGRQLNIQGHCTHVTADLGIEWLKTRPPDKPFFLMCHHKAPHRPWEPDAKHAQMYEEVDIPEPATFNEPTRA